MSGAADPAQTVELLRRLAAGAELLVPGPPALDIRDCHQWVTTVTIEPAADGPLLSWHGGHHHVNRISGPLHMAGDALHIPTHDRVSAPAETASTGRAGHLERPPCSPAWPRPDLR